MSKICVPFVLTTKAMTSAMCGGGFGVLRIVSVVICLHFILTESQSLCVLRSSEALLLYIFGSHALEWLVLCCRKEDLRGAALDCATNNISLNLFSV